MAKRKGAPQRAAAKPKKKAKPSARQCGRRGTPPAARAEPPAGVRAPPSCEAKRSSSHLHSLGRCERETDTSQSGDWENRSGRWSLEFPHLKLILRLHFISPQHNAKVASLVPANTTGFSPLCKPPLARPQQVQIVNAFRNRTHPALPVFCQKQKKARRTAG